MPIVSIQSLSPPTAKPWQLLVLHSVYKDQSILDINVNGILQCTVFRDRLRIMFSSPSMRYIMDRSGLPFFLWLNHALLYGRTPFHECIHLLMGLGLLPPVGYSE